MHMPTMSTLPMSASAMPPSSPKSGRGFVKKVELERVDALEEDRAEHEREDRRRRPAAERIAERAEDLLDEPPPAEAVRADGDVEADRTGSRRAAHTRPPLLLEPSAR